VFWRRKQEVWPPGFADTVCFRPPLMTQVQQFVSRIRKRQKWDVNMIVSLWPWPLTLDVTAIVSLTRLVLCQSTKYKFWWYYDYSFSIYGPLQWANTVQTDHVTLRHWPLTLEVMAPVADTHCTHHQVSLMVSRNTTLSLLWGYALGQPVRQASALACEGSVCHPKG